MPCIENTAAQHAEQRITRGNCNQILMKCVYVYSRRRCIFVVFSFFRGQQQLGRAKDKRAAIRIHTKMGGSMQVLFASFSLQFHHNNKKIAQRSR